MANNLTIRTFLPDDSENPLYLRYFGSLKMQDAWLRLDQNGVVDLTVDTVNKIHSSEEDVRLERTFIWRLNPRFTRRGAIMLLLDPELHALLAQLHRGHRIVLKDGVPTGVLTDEAKSLAYMRIDHFLDRYNFANFNTISGYYYAHDVVFNCGMKTLGDVWPSDLTLEETVQRIEEYLESEGLDLIGTVKDGLLEELDLYEREELTGVYLDAYDRYLLDIHNSERHEPPHASM